MKIEINVETGEKVTREFTTEELAIFQASALSEAQIAAKAIEAASVVTMRQARLALLGAGLLPSVNAAIEAMTGSAGEAARIEWEYAATVDRASPLVAGLISALSLTTEQLDSLFTQAASQ